MEYMWYTRLEPTINKLVPGLHYYKRDKVRYEGEDPFGAYEELDERLRQTVGRSPENLQWERDPKGLRQTVGRVL